LRSETAKFRQKFCDRLTGPDIQALISELLRSYARAENATDNHFPDIFEAHWYFLEHRLLPFSETGTQLFIHAGASPDLPLPEQSDFMLYH